MRCDIVSRPVDKSREYVSRFVSFPPVLNPEYSTVMLVRMNFDVRDTLYMYITSPQTI